MDLSVQKNYFLFLFFVFGILILNRR